MRGGRRMRALYSLNIFSRLIYFFVCIKFVASLEHGVPVEIKLWDTGRTPLAHMVDVTNEFGLKVLAEHNFLNDNNIAFSPYGLMGIMVALYEGVDGESSYQIQRGMQLPWNRNVMRIGFRDIHRTLKTYFVPEEGFLAGLALNNENVTFNEQYKKILRFYGFDLENDQLPTLSPETNNTSNVTNADSSTMTPANSGDSLTTANSVENKPTTASNREETTSTINPNAETISTIDIRESVSTTTAQSSAPNAESTTTSAVTLSDIEITESVTEPVPLSTITTAQTTLQTEITTSPITTTEFTTVISAQSTTNQVSEQTSTASTSSITMSTETSRQTSTNVITEQTSTTSQSTAIATETVASSTLTNEPSTNNEMDTSPMDMTVSETIAIDTLSSLTTITSADTMTSTIQLSTDSSTMTATTESTASDDINTSLATQATDQMSSVTMTDMSTTVSATTSMANVSTLETLERRKRSLVDFIFTNPPYTDDYLYYRSYDIGSEVNKPNFDDEMFLANGLKSIQVTYMHYDTVLEYAYLPHLEASALRLPLDSDRYYLLVVLPKRDGPAELGRLMSRMARESDLSDIYSVLRPRRVKGIVPSFTVKGHVTLTTDLQKLGIRDVFEPRQRDFTTMTKQAGVYVRSIEQAVSVAIRKYRPDDQKKHRYVTNRDPVVFSATYPFLYFVMDANIHVSLMAGKMVDPLNSRIL